MVYAEPPLDGPVMDSKTTGLLVRRRRHHGKDPFSMHMTAASHFFKVSMRAHLLARISSVIG